MRHWGIIVTAMLLLCGCQGSSRHTVTTGGEGTLEGLQFLPTDHSRDVDTDTDPEIFWLPGYQPPKRFTVSLKRIDEFGDLHSVNTELEQTGANRWRLKVVGTLDEGMFYAIIVRDDTRGEQREAWFLTRKRRHRPLAPPASGSEHTIVIAPKP